MYVDANLLVLLVAGLAERELIGRYRWLMERSVEDYDLLARLVDRAQARCSSPRTR